MNKWYYKQTEPRLWTVGIDDASGVWQTDSDHDTPKGAADRAKELNGEVNVPALLSRIAELETINGELLKALEIIAAGTVDNGWIQVAPQFVQNAIAKAKAVTS